MLETCPVGLRDFLGQNADLSWTEYQLVNLLKARVKYA